MGLWTFWRWKLFINQNLDCVSYWSFFLRTGRFKRSFNWVKLPSETEWRGRGMKLMKVDVRPTGDCLVVSWCFMCRIFIAARDGWKIFANWWRNFQRSWNHMNFPHPSPVLISLDQYWWIVCQKGLTLGRKMNVLIQCWFSFDSVLIHFLVSKPQVRTSWTLVRFLGQDGVFFSFFVRLRS